MHESTADTTISTNGDYSVFENPPNKFILKLTLHEEDSSQLRIVELSSIFDDELNNASYGKLVARIVAAVGYDINPIALKLTYQDLEDDAVVVSSTQELTHAIHQFYDKGMVKFVGNVRRETQINNTLPPITVHVLPTSSRAPCVNEATGIPKDLNIEFPTIRFDPSRASSDLALADDNRRVTTTDSSAKWKCIYSKDGITSGCKYWSFKIVDKATNGNIMIGVSDSSRNLAKSVYPGKVAGCSLYLQDGDVYLGGTWVASSNVDLVKSATVIGVLLNMCQNTVTFYADGKHVGTIGADTNVLKEAEYFPVIALYEQGQCVEVMDLVPPNQT